MKKLTMVGILLVCAVMLMGVSKCDVADNTADMMEAEQTSALQEEAARQVGMPNIHRFTEKKMVSYLYELRDKENLILHAYIYSDYNGQFIYLGKCVGYGIPASVQFSNPEKIAQSYTSSFGTMPQPEPNGLFMPEGLSATWIMLIDDEGKQRAAYVEPLLTVLPFKLPSDIVMNY